jgi:hypothetical protein
LNVDRKELIEQLFHAGPEKDEKASLDKLKESITHYDQAYYEIMCLSEDEVNFRLFRVIVKKLKHELGDQALKCRDRILDRVYQYCNDTINEVRVAY